MMNRIRSFPLCRRPTTSTLRRIGLSLVGCLAVVAPAAAQTDACQRYRAELASIEADGGRDFTALADQQAVELERMRRYYQSLDCGRSRFLVFGAPSSPECSAAEDQLGAMEDNYRRLLTEASRSGNDRRTALISAIDQFCTPNQERRGLFDTLFNRPEEPFDEGPYMEGPGFFEEDLEPARGDAVCVRTCDGFFFPSPAMPRDGREAANLCQAQCPAAITAVFYKPQGQPIEQSYSADGQPYMSLQNALRYRTSFDETCSCRSPGQTWSEALAQAQGMLGDSGDLVDDERARELSRPGGAAPTDASPALPGAGASIPFFGLDEGELRDIPVAGGSRRVRVVAPEVIPAPDTM